jgi:hypothetical protein
MLKVTTILFAGALVFATVSARAVDLPDYGSKNFSPSGETPSYFANEAAPVSARTADTTEADWSAVDEIAPARPAFEGARSAHAHSGRHGRYAIAYRSGRHGAARSGGRVYAARVVSAGGGKTAGTRSSAPSASRTTTARRGKPGARHASAGVRDDTMN